MTERNLKFYYDTKKMEFRLKLNGKAGNFMVLELFEMFKPKDITEEQNEVQTSLIQYAFTDKDVDEIEALLFKYFFLKANIDGAVKRKEITRHDFKIQVGKLNEIEEQLQQSIKSKLERLSQTDSE